MRYEAFDINVLVGVGAGLASIVDRFSNKTVHPHGNFAGGWSVQLQGVVGEHADWVTIGAAITAAAAASTGVIELTHAWKKLRLNTLVVGTGVVPSITFAGQDLRVGE